MLANCAHVIISMASHFFFICIFTTKLKLYAWKAASFQCACITMLPCKKKKTFLHSLSQNRRQPAGLFYSKNIVFILPVCLPFFEGVLTAWNTSAIVEISVSIIICLPQHLIEALSVASKISNARKDVSCIYLFCWMLCRSTANNCTPCKLSSILLHISS